jgi:hypothetical protein
MPQRAATPPLVQNGDATVYLVLDDFREFGSVFQETGRAKADLTTVVADLLPGHIDIPCAWWSTAEGWAATSAQTSRARLSLVRANWTMNGPPRCALWWNGRVGPPEPSLKGTARAHVRPHDDPSLSLHRVSVA